MKRLSLVRVLYRLPKKGRRSPAIGFPVLLVVTLSLLVAGSGFSKDSDATSAGSEKKPRIPGTEGSQPPISKEDLPRDRVKGEAKQGESLFVVTYFHRTLRCATCLGLEQASRETVRGDFADLVTDGTVTWRAVNFDLPENSAYEERYGLEGSSLLFSKQVAAEETHWERLDGIWNHAGYPEEVRKYIRTKLREFLGLPQIEAESIRSDGAGSGGGGDPAEPPGVQE